MDTEVARERELLMGELLEQCLAEAFAAEVEVGRRTNSVAMVLPPSWFSVEGE